MDLISPKKRMHLPPHEYGGLLRNYPPNGCYPTGLAVPRHGAKRRGRHFDTNVEKIVMKNGRVQGVVTDQGHNPDWWW
jgi:hypothetical protein